MANIAFTATIMSGPTAVGDARHFRMREQFRPPPSDDKPRETRDIVHTVIAYGRLAEASDALAPGDRVVVVGEVTPRVREDGRAFNAVVAHHIGSNIVPPRPEPAAEDAEQGGSSSPPTS